MGSRLGLLADFGFVKDVFEQAEMETTDSLRIKRLTTMAIESRAMVAVIGARGFGKTESVKQALAGREKTIIVRLVSFETEAVKIGDIERALILDVNEAMGTQETPKRTREIRARQVRRMVGEAAKTSHVVLVLEEAHRMHGSTLRSLKTLREMEHHGKDRLFTTLMLAQYDPFKNSTAMDEVRLRTDKIELKGLTQAEIKAYIGKTVGRVYEDDAIEAVSRIGGPNGKGQNFLELQKLLCDLMDTATKHGHKKVKAIDVFAFTGGGLKELLKQSGLSQVEAAREANVSTAEVSLLLNGKQGSITDARAVQTRNALLAVVARKTKEKSVIEEVPSAVNE